MGAVNIDNTGSGSAVTLSSDGTDLLLNGSPIGGGASAITISNKTGAYTVVAGDLGTIINCTSGTFTVALTAAATLGSGFNCWIWNTGTGTITIDPASTETIDEVTTLVLYQGEGTQIVCNGANWQTGDKKTMRGYSDSLGGTEPRPNSSGGTSVAIGSFSRATGSSSLAVGRATLASLTGATAIGRDAQATGSNSCAISLNSGGNGSRAVTGSGAMALGGSYASGTDSFAAAVANNTSSYGAKGANSVAIGKLVLANGVNAVAIGGSSNQAKGSESSVIGGQNSETATAASYAVVIGGSSSYADGVYSFAQGFDQLSQYESTFTSGASAYAGVIGKQARASGKFAGRGDAQTGTFVLRQATTNTTATVLTTDGSAPGTTDQVILPNNSAYAFTGTVVARQQASGGTASAAWKVEGLIRREANAASTVLVASTVTAIDNTPGWTLALSADTTNGGLKIEATGAAATNIRWVATVQTSEVTYA